MSPCETTSTGDFSHIVAQVPTRTHNIGAWLDGLPSAPRERVAGRWCILRAKRANLANFLAHDIRISTLLYLS